MADFFRGISTEGIVLMSLSVCVVAVPLGMFIYILYRMYTQPGLELASLRNSAEDRYFEGQAYRQNVLHNSHARAWRRIDNNNARTKLFEGTNEMKQRMAEKKEIAAARNAAELEEAIGLAGRRRKDSSRKSRKSRKSRHQE